MKEAGFKVVFTDHDAFPDLTVTQKIIEEGGGRLIGAQAVTEDRVIEVAEYADGLIVQYAPISRKVIESLRKCKVIVRTGIGYDNVDIEAATEHGICVANVPDFCVGEVADATMALILALATKITEFDRAAKKGIWSHTLAGRMFRIQGRTLGLIGFGKIGKAVAKRAQPFGFDIIAFDPRLAKATPRECLVRKATFEELLRSSDFVSIHAPLTDQTRHILGRRELRMMKKGAYIVNTSRGGLIDEQALYEALTKGWIAGAGLDVLEKEPPTRTSFSASQYPLLRLENVIITSHSSWYTDESMRELLVRPAQEVLRVLKGQWPEALVNPEVKQKARV